MQPRRSNRAGGLRFAGRWRCGRFGPLRFEFRHAQAVGRPSDVEADLVSLIDQVDTGKIAAQWGSDHFDVGKLEADFPPALRADQSSSATAVESHYRSPVVVVWEVLFVKDFAHDSALASVWRGGKLPDPDLYGAEERLIAVARCETG
jgi:hypothetical protein